MASLVLGVAGAAIGSMFGPLGASIGWAVGAGIGNYLTQKDQQGPRLTDLRLQNSAYGAAIPIGYGTVRMAGNVIWSTDLQETEHTSGGKGGPEITTYTYSASFAIGICEGPIVGILRIWADGRLIYGSGSDSAALPMTIYRGDEEQLPDPTIEAVEGVGNVPAHRGMAYIVFTDLQMVDFGNRIPNFTFEVMCSGTVSLEYYSQWDVDFDYPINSSVYSYPYLLNGVEPVAEGIKLHRYRGGQDYGGGAGFPGSFQYAYTSRTYDLFGNLLDSVAETNTNVPYTGSGWGLRGSINSGIAYTEGQITADCSEHGGSASQSINTFQWLKDGIETYSPPNACLMSSNGAINLSLSITAAPLYWAGNVYACGGSISELWLRRWPAPDGSCYTGDYDATFDLRDYSHDPAVSGPFDLALGEDGYLYCLVSYFGGAGPDPGVIGGWGLKLLRFDSNLNLLRTWLSTDTVHSLPTPGFSSFVVYRDYVVGYYGSGVYDTLNPQYELLQMNNATSSLQFIDEVLVNGLPDSDSPPVTSRVTPVVYIGGGLAVTRDGVLRIGTGHITLAEIVADVSDRCGYAVSEYNVSDLTDIVKGYTIGTRMSGRAAIDALRPAYQFGAVESNLQVKFRKWRGDIDLTIPDTDLGARPVDEDPVPPMETTRVQEADLPQSIDVVYINYGMDYQDGQQLAQRAVTDSELKTTLTVPVVLDDDEARRICDVMLFNAWMERDRFRFQLPRKWAHAEPTDVLSTYGRSIRLLTKEEHGYTHFVCEGVATGVNIFVNAPAAVAPIGFVPQPVPVPNHTDLRMLDLPLIYDYDFANGYYAAVAGRMAGAWPGASFYKSSDGGVNYASIGATTTNNAIGVATTALGDFGGGNVFDETNTVTVRLTPGSAELTSSNRTGVLNGANMAVLGSEVFQFRTATLVAANTYTLSGLLRGRRGTEWAISPHYADDIFVLLPVFNINGPFAELGQVRQFKAVTTGQPLASESAVDFTNTGVALLPYAPVQIGGGRNAAGDITINWVRRTRIGGAWVDNVDAPLSEATEEYLVLIYTDSTYTVPARLVVVSTQTTSYTAAQQTTDFGSTQATIYVGVKQNGAYGLGYEGRGTV